MNEIQEIMGRSYGYALLAPGPHCSPWTDAARCAALARKWTRASWRLSSRASRRSGRPRRRARPLRRSRPQRTWPLATICRPRRPGPSSSLRAGRPTSSGCPSPPACEPSEERTSRQVGRQAGSRSIVEGVAWALTECGSHGYCSGATRSTSYTRVVYTRYHVYTQCNSGSNPTLGIHERIDAIGWLMNSGIIYLSHCV